MLIKPAFAFNFAPVHSSWRPCLMDAFKNVQPHYLEHLYRDKNWLPGPEKLLNAFSLDLNQVNYVLFGESPYPRAQSANGYAFWDQAVTDLWSATGLSKTVNRATSLRNLLKMLMVAAGALSPHHTSQADIAQLDKSHWVKTNDELFENFKKCGFLLLNASLVLQKSKVNRDALAWQPFLKTLLACLHRERPNVFFILLGNIANKLQKWLPENHSRILYAEHPYNHSFITNHKVQAFFKPLNLLSRSF